MPSQISIKNSTAQNAAFDAALEWCEEHSKRGAYPEFMRKEKEDFVFVVNKGREDQFELWVSPNQKVTRH